MFFQLYRLGSQLPNGFQKAVDLLNGGQTIWKLKLFDGANKLLNSDPRSCWSLFPSGNSISFCMGITRGKIDQNKKLSLIDFRSRKALVSEFESRNQEYISKISQPPEVFWALALANVCFQVSISSCSTENCLGYKNYTIESLLLKLLELHICSECEHKILGKYKYRFPELKHFIDVLRRPGQYGVLPLFDKPHLPTFERQVRPFRDKPIFKGIGIIIIMHFLENLVSFIDGLISLGAKQESMAVIVKPYPYLHRPAVHGYLYQHYPNLHIEYLDKLPPKKHTLKTLVEHCRDKSRLHKILVIEDGGYLVPFLHNNYSRQENFCMGAVEQTTKGIRHDEELEKKLKKKHEQLYFPILNVAKSDFKDMYESPLVGRSVVHTIQKLLNEEHFSGKRALVVGFGAVGREVASSLQKIGMIVRVYDKKLEQLAAAKVRGFEASANLASLAEGIKLIVGTTGTNSVKRDLLEQIEDGTILVSASSDQIEIDVKHLEKMCSKPPSYKQGIGTDYIKRKSNSEDKYTLLADGFPINFYFGSGIPTRSIDPVLSQLLVASVHLAKGGIRGPGISNKMNELIRSYGLLKDFIDTFND